MTVTRRGKTCSKLCTKSDGGSDDDGCVVAESTLHCRIKLLLILTLSPVAADVAAAAEMQRT